MNASTAAMMAYLKRLATTPPTSESCVTALTMVVSLTGARLSPNTAPDRIAPNISSGSAPSTTPAGKNSATKAITVP
jgi:hypothetical protein